MIIDVHALTRDLDTCALIICMNTGVSYTAQCGGYGCTHPIAEGVFLPLWDIAKDLDECKFGCSNITKCKPEYDKPELRQALAEAIDLELKKLSIFSFSLNFDYSRIDELQEGWWPLEIRGTLHDVGELNHKCYYHRGNCD